MELFIESCTSIHWLTFFPDFISQRSFSLKRLHACAVELGGGIRRVHCTHFQFAEQSRFDVPSEIRDLAYTEGGPVFVR